MKISNKVFLTGIVLIFIAIFSIFMLRLNNNQYNINNYLFPKFKRTKLIDAKGKNVSFSKNFDSNLQEITLDGLFNVNIQQSDSNKIKIVADENVIRYLIFQPTSDKLKIQLRPGFQVSGNSKINVFISTHSLKKILVKGNNVLNTAADSYDKLLISAQGENIINLNGKFTFLNVNVAGKGKLTIKSPEINYLKLSMMGEVTSYLQGFGQNLIITGVGDFKLFSKDFICDKIRVESIASNSEMELHANKILSIATLGTNKIKYYGHPNVIKKTFGSNIVQVMPDPINEVKNEQ